MWIYAKIIGYSEKVGSVFEFAGPMLKNCNGNHCILTSKYQGDISLVEIRDSI